MDFSLINLLGLLAGFTVAFWAAVLIKRPQQD